jgi:UDP-N-acetylmuramoylalanine--D-glutamate ligase
VLLIGSAVDAIRDGLGARVALETCGDLATAVRAGFEGARPGDVVLLSPGCASFDQYRDFAERGNDFRAAVEALSNEGNGHA